MRLTHDELLVVAQAAIQHAKNEGCEPKEMSRRAVLAVTKAAGDGDIARIRQIVQQVLVGPEPHGT